MICWREQWMPDSRPLGRPDPERIVEDQGTEHATNLRALRSDLGLDQPYGPKAVALKLGDLKPVAVPAAETEEDPAEPEELPVIGQLSVEPVDDDVEERLPSDAAAVPLDDLPF